jgi:hypothetical protein
MIGYLYYRFVYQRNRNHNGRPKVDSCTSSTESGITEVTQKTLTSSKYEAICEKNLLTKSSSESMKNEEVGSSESKGRIILGLLHLEGVECGNNVTTVDLNQFENLDILEFPDKEEAYKFNINDLCDKCCIERKFFKTNTECTWLEE